MTNIQNLLERQPFVKSLMVQIGEIASKQKEKAYAVGGAVRDVFIGNELKEIDIMVIGDGIEFAKVVAKQMGVPKIVPFHRFSTAHIPSNPYLLRLQLQGKKHIQKTLESPIKLPIQILKAIY